MGILSGLFRSRDKPTDRTAGSSYSFFLGGTSSGKYVTERSGKRWRACHYNFTDIPMMAVKSKRWNIRFIFCSMMSRIRR